MYAQQDDTHGTRILKYGLGSLRGPGRTLITCVSRVSNLGKEGCSEAYLRLDGGSACGLHIPLDGSIFLGGTTGGNLFLVGVALKNTPGTPLGQSPSWA